MRAKEKTLAILARHERFLNDLQRENRIKFASKDEFKADDNEVGSFIKRAIPKGHAYDPKAIKPLARMLWAMSVSLGHALTAHRQFTKLKSSTISPDGLIGGRGYVMSVKDVRKMLFDACENLSAISDTVHDELHAPHWKPKLAELEKGDVEKIERLVGDAERMLDNPEGDIEDDMEEAEEEGPKDNLDDEPRTGLPGSGSDLVDSYAPTPAAVTTKQASVYTYRRGNSSMPVETFSGPRVEHLDRGDTDQTGPFGSHNEDEPQSVKDDWSKDEGVGNDYAYPSEWDNELLDRMAAGSNLPGILTDDTPTETRDFGLGYGEGNDAHGQGSEGYGTRDSDGKQIYGPHTELPHDPGGKLKDEEVSDSTPVIELEVGRSNLGVRSATAVMPGDVARSVARSDYFYGDRGDNQVNAEAELPGAPEKNYEFDKDMQPGTGYKYEQGAQPYVKWDSDTHNMRPDYVYQRDDTGPYERE